MTTSKLSELDFLVLQTLAYSSCFNFALTAEEVIKRLPYSEKFKFSRQKIRNSLKKLLQQSLLQSDNQYFYLAKRDLQNRQQKSKHFELKHAEVAKFVALAKQIPFIRAVVLTGSTAVNNAGRSDDLDFMIITRRNTLWLTRMLLIVLTKLKGKRPLRHASNAWCFNLLLDEGDLSLTRERHSLYEAYEILQMQFVLDRGELERAFLDANSWLRGQLFFYASYKFGRYQSKKSFSLLNYLLFMLQKTYRHLVFGRENFALNLTQAFFNELAFREQIFAKLERKMKGILPS